MELMVLQFAQLKRQRAYNVTQANWDGALVSEGQMLTAAADDSKHSVQISSCG